VILTLKFLPHLHRSFHNHKLSDEKDIASALTGAPHANDLKNILITLDSRGQTLIIGHGNSYANRY